MKRIALIAVFAIAVFAAFSLTAFATGEEEKVEQDFAEIVPDGIEVDISDTESTIGAGMVFREILFALGGAIGSGTSFFAAVFGLAVLISLAERSDTSQDGKIRKNTTSAVVILASVSIFSLMFGVLTEIKDGLCGMVDFSASLLPIMTFINASVGAVSTAGSQAVNMNIVLALVGKFAIVVLLPVAVAVFSLSFVGAACEEDGTASVARGFKSFFMWGIGIVGAILAIVFSVQSVISSAKDTATLRAIRYAASGTIPIVGSTVASALSTLGGGLAFIKSAVGGASVFVILALSLSPLVSLLIYRIAFSVSLIFLEFTGASGGVRSYSAFRSSLDCIIAVYAVSVLLLIIQILVFLRGGIG